MARRAGLATAARYSTAFGGGPFVVAGPEPIQGPEVGGFSGFPDNPQGITLRFQVGPRRRMVQVETTLEPGSRVFGWESLAVRVLMHQRRVRFPIVIERVTQRVRIEGRVRAFKGCAVQKAFAIEASVGDVLVRITCEDGHPGGDLALVRLEGGALKELLRAEGDRWNPRLRKHS